VGLDVLLGRLELLPLLEAQVVPERAELLLRARGEWKALVEDYVAERSRDEPGVAETRVQVAS